MAKKIFIKATSRIQKKKSKPSKKKKVKVSLLLFITFFIALSLGIWISWDIPLISPINSMTTFKFLSESNLASNNKKVVYGFLPYWNTKKVTIQDELTHLGYFSLTVGADGSFVSEVLGEANMGLIRLNSDEFSEIGADLIDNNRHVEIVISQFNADDIAYFLASEKAQDKFLEGLDSVLLAYPINGVNIDFETSGSTNPRMRSNLTNFMKKLRDHLNTKYNNVGLSIDMYAGAAQNQQLWEVEEIAPLVDHIVVMAYDFHRSSSSVAGPVAPLFGGKDLWDGDINNYLQSFLDVVPSEKILLGVPFYGYEWQTTSRDSQSHTFPDTGATASYSRVLDLLDKKEELKVQEHWNEDALSPYISYVEDGGIYVVYYENSRSISYKLDYVNQLDLGGVAIWALGYEGDSRELWDVIDRKVNLDSN